MGDPFLAADRVRAKKDAEPNLTNNAAKAFALLDHLIIAASDFGFNAGQTVVHPIIDEGFTRAALTLGEFIFVMREHQIHASAVDVEGFTEILHAHRRAFDMPTRPAGAPR